MFWLQLVAGVLLVAGTGLCLGFVRWLDQQGDAPTFVSEGYRAKLRLAEPKQAESERDWLGKAA
jgi:hypothetical protein